MRHIAASYLIIILLLPLLTACDNNEERAIDAPPSAEAEEGKHPFVEATDSTFTAPLRVCRNQRILLHKTFEGLAERGKCTFSHRSLLFL